MALRVRDAKAAIVGFIQDTLKVEASYNSELPRGKAKSQHKLHAGCILGLGGQG